VDVPSDCQPCPSAPSVSLAVSDTTPDTGDTITLTTTAMGFVPTNYVFYARQGSDLYLLGQNGTGVLNWVVDLIGAFTLFVNADDTLTGSFNVGGNSVTSTGIIIQAGLQLHLDPHFSGISGTNYPDLSPFGRDGTLINSPTVDTSLNGGNILFNGVNQRIGNIGAVADFSFIQNTAVFTIMGWFNPAVTTGRQFAMSTATGTAQNGFFLTVPETTSYGAPIPPLTRAITLLLFRGSSGVAYYIYSDLAINTTGWVHVAITMNGLGTGQIYRNGEFLNTMNQNPSGYTLASGNSSNQLNVGSLQTSFFYNGRIAPVQIYNAPLSAAQVMFNFNVERSRYGL
jgi:hypothetical protein